MKVYSVSSAIDWTIITSVPRTLSTFELFHFETFTSDFLSQKIKLSPYFKDVDVYATNVAIKDQTIDTDKVLYFVNAEVTITYCGTVIDDLSSLLAQEISNDDADELLNTMIPSGLFDTTSVTMTMSFEGNEVPNLVESDDENNNDNKRSDGGKISGLFLVLIAISGCLALASAVLLFYSGCCSGCCKSRKSSGSYGISKQDMNIPQAPTEDSEEAESVITASGNLGAKADPTRNNNNCNDDDTDAGDLPVPTPQRGIYRDYPMTQTPMSYISEATNVTSNVSTVTTIRSREPLGIKSMNTLKRLMFEATPKTDRKNNDSMYNVDLNDI